MPFKSVTGPVPAAAASHYNHAIDLEERGDHAGAIAQYTEAIKLHPRYLEAYFNRANARTDVRDYAGAVADLTEVLKIDPNRAVAYLSRGINLQAQGDLSRAIEDYNEAIRLDPKNARAYANRGRASDRKREYETAIQDYNEALRLDPTLALIYNSRAWIWATCPDAQIRDGKKAVESATRACELTEWKEPNNIDTLAAAYAEAGDFDAALEWQSKGTDMAPESDKANFRSRLALYQQRKPYHAEPKK